MNSQQILDRRKQFVPNAIGIFNPSTAVSAHGSIITDADGKEMIDFAGGIGVVNAGHCPLPVVAAIAEQAAKMIHCSFNVASYELYMQLAEKLVELFPHCDKTKVMLTNSGAESVENAIKIARQATGRQAIICYDSAFHGRTMMAMTLTSKVGYKVGCGPYAPEVYRIPFPDYYKSGNGLSEDDFSAHHLRELEDFFHTNVPENQVAAIIMEPVQGEGGFNVVPKKYLQGLRKICDQYGILLILDEVQSGFGRTGKWAAYQHFDVAPDISTWAKSMGSGMPIGCVIGKAEIMDSCKPSTIGGTYPGNPVCCAAAIATIKYMEEININALGEKVGNIVRDRFNKMKENFFPFIGDVRGLGAMMAFELVKNNDPHQPDADTCKKLIGYCAANGLIIINAGVNGNVIRILSPLVIEENLLNKGLDIIENGLKEILG